MIYHLIKWADALYHTVAIWADKHIPGYDLFSLRRKGRAPWFCEKWERMNEEGE